MMAVPFHLYTALCILKYFHIHLFIRSNYLLFLKNYSISNPFVAKDRKSISWTKHVFWVYEDFHNAPKNDLLMVVGHYSYASSCSFLSSERWMLQGCYCCCFVLFVCFNAWQSSLLYISRLIIPFTHLSGHYYYFFNVVTYTISFLNVSWENLAGKPWTWCHYFLQIMSFYIDSSHF